jgi:O-antigen/teichoic acid export membrane protein
VGYYRDSYRTDAGRKEVLIKVLQFYIHKKANLVHERSAKAVKNIIASFAIKGVTITAQLLLVPITIHYINPTRYGIWLTLSSIIGWFGLFDIGFGNGLRNRFAEAKATGNYEKARDYVSTTYICLGAVFFTLWLLFILVNFFLDWSVILNVDAEMAKELSRVALVVFSFFCIQMVLSVINTVLIADQQPAKSAFFDMTGQLLGLTIIFVLTKTTSGSLLALALAFSSVPVLIMMLSSFWLYGHGYQVYRPSWRFFRKDCVQDIIGLGSKFFILQISAILLYQSANIIIAQLFNAESVTVYNIAYKYFMFPYSLFIIVIAPMWSAYTDAYVKNDIAWMLGTLKKMRLMFALMAAAAVVLLVISPMAYRLWIGHAVKVPYDLSVFLCAYTIALTWVAMHTYIINGMGRIGLQFLFSVCEMVLYVPLAIALGKLIGINGVVLSMIIFAVGRAIWTPLQVEKLCRKKATGIWNR